MSKTQRPRLVRSVLAASWLTALAALSAGAAQDTKAYRVQIEKWVEARQLASEEKADWEEERQSLRATRDLLEQQKKALEADVAELEENYTTADEERRGLLLDRGELQRATLALENSIRSMEEEVMAIAKQLPAPLQVKLEPLLVQIPEDPRTTHLELGHRLMNVLGVLAQAEKFNGTATFVGETRPLADGQKVQVRTLYWGLGQAIFVDAQGKTAGIGRPGPEGWVFEDIPELADEAALLLDIYEGNVDVIDFVELPVAIQ